MRFIPSQARTWLISSCIIASIFGISFDWHIGNKIDYWIHDSAVVYQARTEWKYTGIVLLDPDIPLSVSRRQSLPLYAKATERLVAAGAKGVYLDARLSKKNEGAMPYAVCIEEDGDVFWSLPKCSLVDNKCTISESPAGLSPLEMTAEVFSLFKTAPYLDKNHVQLPDFLLYGFEASIPEEGLIAFDRLVRKDNSPIARWMDLSDDHANITMAKFISQTHIEKPTNVIFDELCDRDYRCRRVRFGYPQLEIDPSNKKPIVPLSLLSSCNEEVALEAASFLKDRIVILQLTTPTESTDLIITPMTTAIFGPNLLTPGAQYLVDSIETLLNDDHPREPHMVIKIILFICAAIVGVYSSAYLKRLSLLWVLGFLISGVIIALCFFIPVVQLWPVTVTLLTFLIGAMLTIALHLLIGLRENQLILQYMPKQVHDILFTLDSKQTFNDKNQKAIVLMSDLKGYTTVTWELKNPSYILNFMNDYLNQTSSVLQNKYKGWLEGYVGDMVCYYWPYSNENEMSSYQNAILGAIELSKLQKKFFSTLWEHYQNTFEAQVLRNMQEIMDAGIGLSAGVVVMGNLGPRKGIRKFGILGDPLNLTSRIEGLTRHFNTQILITEDFLTNVNQLGLPTRRLGSFRVKGRPQPILLYALGDLDDIRFQPDLITAWENWLVELETSSILKDLPSSLTIFQKDFETFSVWYKRGLLQEGIWYLNEK